MNSALKSLVALGCYPLSYAVSTLASLQRLWVYCRLYQQLPHVPSSIVALDLPELHGTRNIKLGNNLYLYKALYWETRGEGKIVIGDEVVMSRGVHLVAYYGIQIGAGSMIGEYCSIRDANHVFGPGIAPRHSGYTGKPIVIGNRVWIGRGVCILPGVTIGDGAVIGANAVVTHDIAANCIAVGIPAREIAK